MPPQMKAIYVPSPDVAAHVIEGETVLIPTVSGTGGDDGEFFRLNRTGYAVWGKLDGNRDLSAIIRELAAEFEAPEQVIQADVFRFIVELHRRRMIRRQPPD